MGGGAGGGVTEFSFYVTPPLNSYYRKLVHEFVDSEFVMTDGILIHDSLEYPTSKRHYPSFNYDTLIEDMIFSLMHMKMRRS